MTFLTKITEFLGRLIKLIFILIFGLIIWFSLKPAKNLQQLKLGMPKQEVLRILGEPIFLKSNAELCDERIIDVNSCKNIYDLGAKTTLYWKVGIDTWIVAGFDENTKLCFKGGFDS